MVRVCDCEIGAPAANLGVGIIEFGMSAETSGWVVGEVPSRKPVVLDAAAPLPLFATVKPTVTVPPAATEVGLAFTYSGTRSGDTVLLVLTEKGNQPEFTELSPISTYHLPGFPVKSPHPLKVADVTGAVGMKGPVTFPDGSFHETSASGGNPEPSMVTACELLPVVIGKGKMSSIVVGRLPVLD